MPNTKHENDQRRSLSVDMLCRNCMKKRNQPEKGHQKGRTQKVVDVEQRGWRAGCSFIFCKKSLH